MSDLIFSVKGSVGVELKRFKAISSTDPARGKQIYANGEKLIVLAGSGELNQFKRHATEIDREDILSYFSAKALMASLIGGHLVLTGYILDNGYPLQLSIGLPNVLNDCLRELCDYECVSIVKLFIEKGQDVNKQEQGTWLAPLHIAVMRELVDTIQQLVSAGADVNIVGDGDVMPLTLAQQLPDSSCEKQRIVDFLSSSGARATWRRQDSAGTNTSANNTYFSTEFTSNTQIKAGPTSSTSAKPVVVPSAGPGAPIAGEKVRFNGSQLSAVPTTSTGNKKVSFNGASLVLEQVTLPPPPPPTAPRTSVPDLALPRVSVSTASGERLLPPPRVLVAAGAGPVEEAAPVTVDTGASGDVESMVADVNAVANGTGADEVEDLSGNLAHGMELNGDGSVEQGVIGAFQMSEDGEAMLFSTG